MKALSVVSPAGSRIAAGLKLIELRRWRPDLEPSEDLLIVENGRYLRGPDDEDPDGRAVAVVRVARVRPWRREDLSAAAAASFEEGWLAWELTDVRPVHAARPVRAARGIYEVEFSPE
jgi:hypothetical protein